MGYNVVLWFVAVFGASFGSSHQKIKWCNLSDVASLDNFLIRQHVYDFLNFAETKFTKMEEDVRKIQCQCYKGNLSQFIQQAAIDWGECMTRNPYFGGFVNDTLQKFMDFFCENDKNYIAEYFTEEAKQCRSDILKPLFDQCLTPLLSSSGKKDYALSVSSFLVPQKKDDLCRRITEMKPCIISTLEQYCSPLATYQQLSANLYTQTIQSCGGYITLMTSYRVIGWTLFLISAAIALIVRFCPVRKWIEDCRHRMSTTHPRPSVCNLIKPDGKTNGDPNGGKDGNNLYNLVYGQPAIEQR